jgi:hypothetical protein
MKVALFLVILLTGGLGSGCGTRNVYEGLRMHQDLQCQELQGSDRNECLRRNEMSYDEYQRQLKERENGR